MVGADMTTTTLTVDPATIPIEESINSAPVIFFDGALGIVSNGPWVKFNFYQDQVVATAATSTAPPLKRVICARMVTSQQSSRELAKWLQDYADRLPTNGEIA